MSDSKTSGSSSSSSSAKTKTTSANTADKGYLGLKVDPEPNSAHSLQSGPASPGPADVRRVHIDDLKED